MAVLLVVATGRDGAEVDAVRATKKPGRREADARRRHKRCRFDGGGLRHVPPAARSKGYTGCTSTRKGVMTEIVQVYCTLVLGVGCCDAAERSSVMDCFDRPFRPRQKLDAQTQTRPEGGDDRAACPAAGASPRR